MSELMQLRVWLVDSEPEIWRRLVVDPRLTLEQLHTVLQHAFGWTNSHMHQFQEKDGTRYAAPSPYGDEFDMPAIDERTVRLAGVFDRKKKRISYEYDFGDSWTHAVELEKTVDSDAVEGPPETAANKGKGVFWGKTRAAACLAGNLNGPPEDCGGLGGYYHLLELKRHPPHPTAKKDADARDMLEWLGDWEPDRFDLAEINGALARVRVKKGPRRE